MAQTLYEKLSKLTNVGQLGELKSKSKAQHLDRSTDSKHAKSAQ